MKTNALECFETCELMNGIRTNAWSYDKANSYIHHVQKHATSNKMDLSFFELCVLGLLVFVFFAIARDSLCPRPEPSDAAPPSYEQATRQDTEPSAPPLQQTPRSAGSRKPRSRRSASVNASKPRPRRSASTKRSVQVRRLANNNAAESGTEITFVPDHQQRSASVSVQLTDQFVHDSVRAVGDFLRQSMTPAKRLNA